MVIICKRYKMFYVGTILLRDVMGEFQYKMWFSIRVRGASPDPQCFSVHLPFSIFSGVELKLCFLLENVNILLK